MTKIQVLQELDKTNGDVRFVANVILDILKLIHGSQMKIYNWRTL